MPLASNATIIKKKSAVPPKQPLRRSNNNNSNVDINCNTTSAISDGPIKTTRRDSIGSCGSYQSIKSCSNNLTLPKSVPSTTIMTKSKVEHRRRSLSTMKAKENHYCDTDNIPKHISTKTTTPKKRNYNDSMNDDNNDENDNTNNYSPPETRSATKNKKQKLINTNFFNTQNNALLQFSPPNHIKNQLIEQERIQQKEYERAQRIAEARRKGQLLLQTMKNANDSDVKEDNDHDHVKKQDVNITFESDKKIDATSTSSNEMKVVDEDLLKKMSDEVSRLTQSQIEAKNERRKSDAELLQKVHDMIAKEKDTVTTQSLSLIQNTTLLLEQNNNKLMNEIKELNNKLVHEKEVYINDTNQLNIQLQQSNEKINLFEQLQTDLQNQITILQNEKVQSQETANKYQQLYETLQKELQQFHDQIELLKNTSNQNQQDTLLQMEQLQNDKNTLQMKLQQEQESYEQLQITIQSYTDTIYKLENEMIPNLQVTIENERDTIARLEQSNEIRQNDLDIANETIVTLQNDIQELQKQYSTIQDTLQICLKDYEMKLQEINTLTIKFDEQTNEIKNQYEIDIQQLNDTNSTIQKSNDTLIVQQKQLNDALEDTMIQLDQVENEKRTIETKLQSVIEQMNTLQSNLSATNTETAQTIIKLQEQLQNECQLRKDAEQIRIELDTIIRNQKNEIQSLKHELSTTQNERDVARTNMDGYNEREMKLYQQLIYYENIRQKLHEQLIVLLGNIRVFIRIRPKLINEMEQEEEQNDTTEKNNIKRTNQKSKEVMKQKNTEIFHYPTIYEKSMAQSGTTSNGSNHTDITKNTIEVIAPYKDRGGLNDRQQKNIFHFDQIFTPTHTQENIWENVEPLIQCTVDGYNVTIFAYGQTGSGKTYTMLGEEGINEGIIGRTVRKLFDEKQKIIDLSRGKSNITISVELLEIYNEKVRDLLSSNKEDLKVTSNEVVGNILVETNSVDDVLRALQLAQSRRCVKATQSNQVSSRSHMIFTIHFQVVMEDGVTTRTGKVHICDLAGSERLSHSGANIVGGELLEETKNINKSLSVLSNVIERLQSGETKNVPFRESKLTHILKDSLCGNSKTLAIICCNPLASHYNESLCSLRFAEKVNRVDLKAVANFR